MPPAAREYLHDRCLDDAAIERFKIGYTEGKGGGWFTIPVRGADGAVAFHKLRAAPGNDSPNKMRYEPTGASAELYGRGLLTLPNVTQVVICEGEMDAMLLISANICAVTSTSGSQSFKDEWTTLFPKNCHVILAFDADEAGEKGRRKVADAFRRLRPDCRLSHIRFDDFDRKGFDVTDFFIDCAQKGCITSEAFLKRTTEEETSSAVSPAVPQVPKDAPKEEFLSDKQLIERTLKTITTFDPSKLCLYPIDQLNLTLQGIFPGETVVVMADSGAGKSDFLRLTSERVSAAGKKVLFYQLEMDQQENTRRRLLRNVNTARSKRSQGADGFKLPMLTPIDLAMGKIDADDTEVIVEALEKAEEGITTYAGRSLTLKEFFGSVNRHIAAHGKPDLICLDHIHYFSREEGMPEHESLSHASRQIRGFCIETNIPVLMAAHVRKRKKSDALSPDDIHGSGSILKEATTCIGLTRKAGETHVAIWKSRIGGELLKFDQMYDIFRREWSGKARNLMGVDEESFDEMVESVSHPEPKRERSQRAFNLA